MPHMSTDFMPREWIGAPEAAQARNGEMRGSNDEQELLRTV
jgi:hypothetical protein